MNYRTDLALELTSDYKTSSIDDYITVTDIKVDASLSKRIGKPVGDYVTIESRIVKDGLMSMYDRLSQAISDELKKFTMGAKNVLVIGLGNPNLTADALGSKVFNNLTVTRHISEELKNVVSLSAFCPNVMGVTGIESFDVISGIVSKINPDLIIAVDSLASAAVSRLACAFQVCSSGITPGSGIGNHRKRLDKTTLGAKVISVGVPLVVYADIIVFEALKENAKREEILGDMDNDLAALIVTPKEIDALVDDCGKVIASAINSALGIAQ